MAGFVGEAVLSGFIQKLIDMVTSSELWNFASEEHVHSELNKWKKILTKIYAVLHDAEEKHMTDPLVKMWLDELRDLAYDVEDILDSFATEALRRNLMAETLPSGTQPSTSKLRSLIPSCCTSFTPNAIKFNAEMWSKIKKITARLQEISAQRNDLHLTENIAGDRSTKPREILPTTSLVDESRVYGRETDKAAIANLLLRDDPCTDEVCVIPVVGMAGIGKTTLAQLAFNDDEVKAHFDLRVWVHVSDDFDVLKITKTILQSVSPNTHDVNDLNLLQMTLRENLSGKKFLLILDDVWNENHDSWEFLCMPMRSGKPGSKLIVTTRNEGVVSITRTLPAYRLQELSYEDCLSVFTQQALGKSNFDVHSHLKEVGEEIVRKCKGLPLTAKALGGMLRNQVSHDVWENILRSKIWDLPKDKCRIIPALKLSYHHLPSHLKQCFAYCSIFPKGYEFNKDELIQLWMAEGFLQQTKENTWPEDLGSKYFYDLLSRSFFQQSNHNSSRFVMHDLINDLAKYIAGETCFNLEGILVNNKQSTTFKRAHHSSFNSQEYEMSERFEVFHKMKCLRTLVALPLNAFSRYHFISNKVIDNLIKQFKYLRVLSLSGYYISGELPHSIGDLRHLRYLNLSNSSIKMLPDSVSHLYNLQTLILSDCWRLTKLPIAIGGLINLRHIDISGTSQLQEIPSISKLTSLQTLSKYIVGESDSLRIRELKNLQDLRGKLSISGLHNVVDTEDAMHANLEEKHYIEELTMEWGGDFGNPRKRMNEMIVLEGLRPPRNLKRLTVAFYGGPTFSGWIRDPSFPSMTQLILKNCRRCTSLPSLGKLSLLKTLHIEGMSDIRSIDVEFYGAVTQPFPSLEFLKFENMPKWKDWFFPNAVEGVELFPRLRDLTIRKCSKLVTQLPDCLPSLVKLDISKCRNLAVSFSRFASLGELNIEECKDMVLRSGVVADSGDQLTSRWVCSGLESAVIGRCDWLVSLDDQRLPCNLKMLKIADCVNLKSLQNGLQNLTCLEELEMMGCLAVESFPETGLPPMLRRLVLQKCRSLRSLPHNYSSCPLESLEIRYCPSIICFPHGGLPSTLKQLMVADCIRLKYLPDGMMHRNSIYSNNDCCLQILRIHDCKSLKFFPRGKLPPTLERLEIRHCSNLESVSEKMWPNNTALEYLEMKGHPNLKILPECLHSVKQLKIEDCGGLEGFQERGFSAPNLRELRIWRCQNLKCLPHQMKNLTSLQVLSMENSLGLESFPEGGLAPNLKFLSIINCKNLKTPISEWGLHTLTSLSTLKIWETFPGKASLWDNKCLFPTSLTNLHINYMESLTSLDLKNIISLQHLYIGCCPKLHSLRLRATTLSSLEIIGCPLLQEKQFPSIAHIPKFKIDGRVMYSTGGGKKMETESHSTLSLHCSIRYNLVFISLCFSFKSFFFFIF
ncbi:hypothetical protein PVL29_017386 [Vitis rotundifolia]|uniref:Disease resistance RPP13-like protein 1 n=1 Tax=Vitis rotundifolia TaxID=103349 RepID=A0AA38ZAB2_VITRO|nr:hypothetical protein PVL29_017386 [Vitis rotundifolia]